MPNFPLYFQNYSKVYLNFSWFCFQCYLKIRMMSLSEKSLYSKGLKRSLYDASWLLLKSRQWVRLGKYIVFDCGITVLL